MPSINLDLDYFTHPKTRRLIGRLGRGAEVYPLRLWCYCGKFHPGEGSLSDYSVQELESILEFPGESGKLIEALLAVGFLHRSSNGALYIHDWLEHSGHLSAFKDRAQKAAKTRWEKYRNKPPVIPPDDATSITCNATSIASSNALTIPTIPTKPTNQPKAGWVGFRSLVEKLRDLGVRGDVEAVVRNYGDANVADVLAQLKLKTDAGEQFRDKGGWIVSQLKLGYSDLPDEAVIQAKIEALKQSEAYARGHCPPEGKTMRMLAIERLRRRGDG